MTVNTENYLSRVVTDSVQTSFTYGFLITAQEDLVLLHTPTGATSDIILDPLTYNADTLDAELGGICTIDSPPDTGTMVLVSVFALRQTIAFGALTTQDWPAIGRAMDLLTRISQQLGRDINRSMLVPLSVENFRPELSVPQPDTVLAYAPDGLGIVNGPSIAEIATAQTHAANAATSKTNAGISEGNANASEQNALASEQAAIDAVESVIWQVEMVSFIDSPIAALPGYQYVCDTSGGEIAILYPAISVVGEPARISVRKYTGDANNVVIYGNGTDTLEGAASYTISTKSAVSCSSDADPSPKNWSVVNMGGRLANPVDDIFVDGVGFQAGVDNSVTASRNLDTVASLWVYFDGVKQANDTITVSGTTITFDATIPGTIAKIDVKYFETVEIGKPSDNSVTISTIAPNTLPYDIPFNAGIDVEGAAEDIAVQQYGYLLIARDMTISNILANLQVGPTGAGLTFDIKVDGVSIYSVIPSFADGGVVYTPGTISDAAITVGSILTFHILTVGLTTPGQQLAVTIEGTLD
ncbi:hypothetical protein COB52_00085 [Candidatus Kaiserbacteria bacterium]|nr:MAG: hypothetical protein COB52_00085 [Candidatus Kaiserbacteria bacterium]